MPSDIEEFFKGIGPLAEDLGNLSTIGEFAKLLYDFTQLGRPDDPQATPFDVLAKQLSAKLDEVVNKAVQRITDAVARQLREQEVRGALVKAFGARRTVKDWVALPDDVRTSNQTDYSLAKSSCDEAIENLSRDEKGQPFVATKFEVDDLAAFAIGATIRVNVLFAGALFLSFRHQAWHGGVTEHSGFVEEWLPVFSDSDIRKFNSRHVISEVNQFTIDPVTGEANNNPLGVYLFDGQELFRSDNPEAVRAALDEGLRISAGKFINRANLIAETVRGWRREQKGWRWCQKCQGLFFGDNPGSRCPKGGQHDGSQSANYGLLFKPSCYDDHSTVLFWCNKCQGLFDYDSQRDGDERNAGVCPVDGGVHTGAQSSAYCLPKPPPGGFPFLTQSGWGRCGECQGLFFTGNGAGVCPAGGGHSAEETYVVKFATVFWPER